jgi:phage-related protein
MNEPKRVPARFFRNALGNEPVRDWLKSLSKEDKFLIGGDIKTVEYGWPIGMPTCRPMGDGLFEVRTNLSNSRISRVLFSFHGEYMFLLHGFIKKTQKTPPQALELARQRKAELDREDTNNDK